MNSKQPQVAGPGAVMIDDEDLHRFTSEPVSGDQRQSYRYPAQLGQKEAIVRQRGRTYKAQLAEESAGGIAIEAPLDLALAVGEQVEIGIYSGWYRSRVVHVTAGPKTARVGLKRLAVIREAAVTPGDKGKRKWHAAGSPFRTVLIAFSAMVIGIVGSMWLGGDFNFKSQLGLQTNHIPRSYAEIPPNRHLMSVLDGVNLLTQPDAAKTLRLSADQCTTLDKIFVGVSNELASLYETTKNQPPGVWYQRSQGVVNDAVENILCSLTDDQIAAWRKMLIQKRQEQAAAPTTAALR
jgi:hypothetical protein